MLSYNNDSTLKARFVRQTDAHRRADRIMQGSYGVVRDGKWRGCAVACSLRSLDRLDGKKVSEADERDYSNHAELGRRLGVPEILTRLEDRIFEGLPRDAALLWPGQFARAIPVGRDLSRVWPRFALWLLTDPKHGAMHNARSAARCRRCCLPRVARDPLNTRLQSCPDRGDSA